MSTATVLLLGDDEFRSEVIVFTPEDAKEILARRNTHNRSLSDKAVANYARDMASGNWLQNGEAIKFATDGTLLDGQHRLAAIVAAGVSVPMLVVTGLPAATQETMDAGRKRSLSDAFSLRGEAHATVLASVLRRVWMWDQGDYRFNGNARPSTAECAQLLRERPELRRSCEVATHVRSLFRYLPPSVVGTAHHLCSRISTDEAVWFFARLGDGAELPVRHPVLTLRNRVMSESAERVRVPDFRHMAYVIRAWNAVREGRTMDKIIQAPDAAMPMPK